MWKVVHIAQKFEQAQVIKESLQQEGFLVDLKSNNTSGFEIRVTASEAQEANELLYKYRCNSKYCI